MGFLRALLGSPQEQPGIGDAMHLRANWPAALYVIGDIHGSLEQLQALERLIVADGRAIPGEKWLVTVGDYVDRGPDSSRVIDHLLSPPPAGFYRIALLGNHELMMRRALHDARAMRLWLDNGGTETLQSYRVDAKWLQKARPAAIVDIARSVVPENHMAFLKGLGLSLSVGNDVLVFHSGVRVVGGIQQASEAQLLWDRPDEDADDEQGPLVVHGHTPVGQVHMSSRRINVDTGAFATGTLSAVRLASGQQPHLLSTATA